MTGIFSSTHEKTLDACYSINLNSHLVPIISMTRNIRFRKKVKIGHFWIWFVWPFFDFIQDWDSHTHHVRNIHIKTKLKHLLILPGDERSMAKELFNLGNFRAGHFEAIFGLKLNLKRCWCEKTKFEIFFKLYEATMFSWLFSGLYRNQM